jgi:ABC-type Fe3+/spermidine/putrescine transport system ATPase subunit
MEPEVLLLDEPLSNLDAKLRLGIRSELKRIQQDLGVTTVYVTHDQAEALSLSDTVAVMNRGRLIQVGSPQDIYFHPADAFVADFVGTANLLDVTVVEAGGAGTVVSAFDRSWSIGNRVPTEMVGRRISLCVRPESLHLMPTEGPGSLSGTVVQKMFEGSHVRYWVDAGEMTLVVDEGDARRDYPLKSRVSVDFLSECSQILGDAV